MTPPTKGWLRMSASVSKSKKKVSSLVAHVETGKVSVSASVVNTGRRTGTRRIYTRNPPGTWTGIEVSPDGEVVGSVIRETKAKASTAMRVAHARRGVES